MSAKTGAPRRAQAKALDEKMYRDNYNESNDLINLDQNRQQTEAARSNNPQLRTTGGVRPSAEDSNDFPIRKYEKDSRDQKWAMRLKLGEALKNQNFYQTLSSQDLEYLDSKRQQVAYLQFRNWLDNKLNMADPNTVARVKSTVPEYFEDREKVLEEQFELMKRASNVQLRGWQDKEDLFFMYMVETGQIQLPDYPLHKPGMRRNKAADYRAGLFAPWNWFGSSGHYLTQNGSNVLTPGSPISIPTSGTATPAITLGNSNYSTFMANTMRNSPVV